MDSWLSWQNKKKKKPEQKGGLDPINFKVSGLHFGLCYTIGYGDTLKWYATVLGGGGELDCFMSWYSPENARLPSTKGNYEKLHYKYSLLADGRGSSRTSVGSGARAYSTASLPSSWHTTVCLQSPSWGLNSLSPDILCSNQVWATLQWAKKPSVTALPRGLSW